jgi:hypothetical protein
LGPARAVRRFYGLEARPTPMAWIQSRHSSGRDDRRATPGPLPSARGSLYRMSEVHKRGPCLDRFHLRMTTEGERSMTLRVLACMVVLAACGCTSLGRPEWLDPGPAARQRQRAVRFDPYLQDDAAPSILRMPLMDGARPRDFADPVPEVTRSRWWAPIR